MIRESLPDFENDTHIIRASKCHEGMWIFQSKTDSTKSYSINASYEYIRANHRVCILAKDIPLRRRKYKRDA